MKRKTGFLGLILAVAAAAHPETPCPVASDSATISRCAVWQAIRESLHGQGMRERDLPMPQQLAFLPPIVLGPTRLQVIRTAWNEEQKTIEVRLRCIRGATCLPFLVRVQVMLAQAPAIRERLVSPGQLDTSRGVSRSAESGPALVFPGQIATLLAQNRGLRISSTVVCLDRGTLGQQVRARRQNGTRSIRARVVGAGRLEVL